MAIWAAVGAIASVGMGIISANKQSKQAKLANQRDQQAYENAEAQRKARWFQQLSVYGARKNQYKLELNENDIAAQRGYTQAQQGLNDQFTAAIWRNSDKLIEYLQSSGKLSAAGRTGRSINRINTLDIGKLERSAGREVAALTRTKEAFKENVEAISRQQHSQRNALYAPVSFIPVPDLPTPPPIERSTDKTFGYLSAALTGINTYASLGGFGGASKTTDLANSMNYSDVINTPTWAGVNPTSTGALYGQVVGDFGTATRSITGQYISPNLGFTV